MLPNYDKEFFQLALGFPAPWKVDSVELKSQEASVHIYISYDSKIHITDSGEEQKIYDYRKERVWQHLPVFQFTCYIHCRIPRVKLGSGKVKSIAVPWASSHDSYTYLFNNYVIDVLLATHNQTKTAWLVKTSFYTVNTILHKSVKLGLSRRILQAPLKRLNIDEKSIGKGHKYASILVDVDGKRVLDVCEGRDKKSVKKLLTNTLKDGLIDGVEVICMDMWEAFMVACKELMPGTCIAHDKFHIVQYLNKAVDTCRKKEVAGSQLLKNSKYTLLKNENNRSQKQQAHFNEIMDSNLYTAQAWVMANQFKDTVLNCDDIIEAEAYFDMWTDQAEQLKDNIKPIAKLSKTLNNHKEGILNYVKHKITNALIERVNGMIQNIKNIGRGYRRFENLRSAILFFNGKLDLYSHKFL